MHTLFTSIPLALLIPSILCCIWLAYWAAHHARSTTDPIRWVSLVALLPYIIFVCLGLAASIFTVLKPSAKIAGLWNLMALRALVCSAFQWLLNYDFTKGVALFGCSLGRYKVPMLVIPSLTASIGIGLTIGSEWLNPLAPHILRLVLSTTETTFISFFVYKLRLARHSTEERVKECKENKPTHPFLSANEVVFSLLIAVELPPFISSIVCLFNNGQDNFILADLIVLEICLFLSSLGAARWSHPVALMLSQSNKHVNSRPNPPASAEKPTPQLSLECIILFVGVLTHVASQSRLSEGSEPAQWRTFWHNVEMRMDQELTEYTGKPLDDFRRLLSCSGYCVNWTRDETIPFQCWAHLDGVKRTLLEKYRTSDRKVPYQILDERGWESFSNSMQTSGS